MKNQNTGRTRIFQSSVIKHKLRPFSCLLRRFKNKTYVVSQFFPIPRQNMGQAKQHCCVGVVAARMHPPRICRAKRQSRLLLNRQCIHLSAHHKHRQVFPCREPSNHSRLPGHPAWNFKLFQLLHNILTCPLFLHGKLRIAVQLMAHVPQLLLVPVQPFQRSNCFFFSFCFFFCHFIFPILSFFSQHYRANITLSQGKFLPVSRSIPISPDCPPIRYTGLPLLTHGSLKKS